MKRIDPVDLRPASAACILQGSIDIYKGLVDLLRDGVWLGPFFVNIPAYFATSVKECPVWTQMGAYPDRHRIKSPVRTAEEYQWLFRLLAPNPL